MLKLRKLNEKEREKRKKHLIAIGIAEIIIAIIFTPVLFDLINRYDPSGGRGDQLLAFFEIVILLFLFYVAFVPLCKFHDAWFEHKQYLGHIGLNEFWSGK